MPGPLRIVHCLRAPVGGLFRHVRDLAEGQADAGHAVAVICDATARDALTQRNIDALSASCSLGIHQIAMSRQISPRDIAGAQAIVRLCDDLLPAVIHGHGAKGGAFARFAGWRCDARVFYTPHGGTLHYSPGSPAGLLFLMLERMLARATDGIIFESRYSARTFAAKIGQPPCPARVIHNGLRDGEFQRVTQRPGPAEFVFVGELRKRKGLDLMFEALANIRRTRDARAVIVGDGPDAQNFRTMATRPELAGAIHFAGALPAREAFSLGSTLVVPSRAESFPYVVLEALAARMPVIATDAGGIPEMFGDWRKGLVPAGDGEALEDAMRCALAQPQRLHQQAEALALSTKQAFSAAHMVDQVEQFYRNPDRPAQTPSRAVEALPRAG